MSNTDTSTVDEIIGKIFYMTIATASEEGTPWNTPVFFAYDNMYNFYWASPPTAQHSQNIAKNPSVFLIIFDTTVEPGKGTAVYVQAKAEQVKDEKSLAEIVPLIYQRQGKPARKPYEFLGQFPRRIYKAVPHNVWINKDEYIDGHRIDVRIPISFIK